MRSTRWPRSCARPPQLVLTEAEDIDPRPIDWATVTTQDFRYRCYAQKRGRVRKRGGGLAWTGLPTETLTLFRDLSQVATAVVFLVISLGVLSLAWLVGPREADQATQRLA